MILDTCFFIDILKNKPEAVSKAEALEQQGRAQKVTSITVFELWQGTMSSEQLQKIQAVLPMLNIYHFDSDAAKIAGSIMKNLNQKGMKIDPEDAMIAGICLLHNETILTRNIKHFERIDTLKIESY